MGYARQQGHSVEINVRGLETTALERLSGAFRANPSLVIESAVTRDSSRLNLALNTEIPLPSTKRSEIAHIYHETLGWSLTFTDDPPPPRRAASYGWSWRWLPWRRAGDAAEDVADGLFS